MLSAQRNIALIHYGKVDAGKSTMLGVLVKGGLDDGRGKARVNLFRHKHEVESGRTSSVGMEIMGFDTKGEVVASTVPGRKLSWEEIGQRSVCCLTFFNCVYINISRQK
jgi:GTPase